MVSCGSSLCLLCHESSDGGENVDEGKEEPILERVPTPAEEPPSDMYWNDVFWKIDLLMGPEQVYHIKCFECAAPLSESPPTVAVTVWHFPTYEPVEARMCNKCWGRRVSLS